MFEPTSRPSPRVPPLGWSIERSDGVVTVAVSGEIDLSTHAEFTRTIVSALAEEVRVVELDLTAITFLDSSGVHALIAARRHLDKRGAQLVMHEMSPAVRRILELVELVDIFLPTEG